MDIKKPTTGEENAIGAPQILFVITNSALNRRMNTGIENLAWKLSTLGFTVHVLSGGRRPTEDPFKISEQVIYHFTNRDRNDLEPFLLNFKNITSQYKIDVVIGWIINIAELAKNYQHKNIKFIANLGQMPPRSIPLSLLKRAIKGHLSSISALKTVTAIRQFPRLCDYVVANSTPVLEASRRRYGIPHSKIGVIHRGIDIEKYNYCTREKTSETPCQHLLFSGNIKKAKGLVDLLDALEFIPTSVELRLCGPDSDKLISPLKEKAKKLAPRHNLKYLGVLSYSDLIKEQHNADIFVFPSHSEGMPKSLMEAMACGTPVVCSDIPPHKELITHKYNGIMVKTKFPKGLAKGIMQLINDETLKTEIAINARKTIEKKCSIELESTEWARLIQTQLQA